MYQWVESIQIQDGQIPLLPYHEARVNQTRKVLLGLENALSVRTVLGEMGLFSPGLYKCRMVYNDQIEDIIVEPYQIRDIKSVRLVEDNHITYDFKFFDRSSLDALYHMREMCDEIMIVKKGLITDAYYYNFIFEKGGMWYTPASPLLKGCRRASLLDAGILHLADISVEHIHKYDRIHLINAMTEPGKIVLHPNQVIP